MIKKCYYLLAVPIICLFFGTNVFAAETYSTWTSPNTPQYKIRYISDFSLAFIDTDFVYDDGNSGDGPIWFEFNLPFNNAFLFTSDQITKYIYGAVRVTIDIYIPNPNTSKFSFYSGAMYGEPILTETLKIYPYALTNSSNHYKYSLIYVFDGYQPQNEELPGPLMTITNLRAKWVAATMPSNEGVSGTATVTQDYNNLRVEDTPLNRGLVGLIAESIDNSDKVDLMLQYLYDIKMNDISYYQTLTTDVASILSQIQSIDTRLRGILTFMISGFDDVQTVLDLFPSYRTQVLQYWQQLLEMNAIESSAAAQLESQYQDKENQSASLAADLGSLNMPSISVGDLDILARTDATQKANFFGLLSIITNNSFITTLLLIVCTGAIVGFILYGKKS